MNLFLILVITVLSLVPAIQSLSCLEVKMSHEKSCLTSDNESYVQCVRNRMKRHGSDCDYEEECYECDCESCSYSECGGRCDYCCHSCCSNYVQCHTNHCCHKQCHSECRTYDCRSSCRRNCYETVQRQKLEKEMPAIERNRGNGEVYIEGGGNGVATMERGSPTSSQINRLTNNNNNNNNTNAHNITTIINLKNVLNNTNFLDVPINLTYTNKNNITLQEAEESAGTRDNCCTVIGPKQCVPIQQPPYARCFHTRSRQCGSYCSANIVHEENKEVCNSMDAFGQPVDCHKRTAYIPQPQPKCTYTSTWPYVSCGIQPAVACEGCYQHYFNPQANQYKSCPPQCYDGFGMGPLYRQGPFYQPSYSHVPPCMYSPQGCGFPLYGQMPGGFNNYGPNFQSPFFPAAFQNPGFQWSFPSNFNQTFNMTGGYSNNYLQGQIPEKRAEIITENLNDMPAIPLEPIYNRKEIEIDVKITKPNRTKTHHHLRPAAKRTKSEREVSVLGV